MQRLPCLGAEKIDVEPTRGLNAATGKERIGKDVQRELTREGIANAIRPIAGLDAKQFEVSGRRMQLTADAQRECRNLDQALPGAEQNEKQAAAADLPSAHRRPCRRSFTMRVQRRTSKVLLSPLLTRVRMIRSTLGALKVIDPESANDRVECARIEV